MIDYDILEGIEAVETAIERLNSPESGGTSSAKVRMLEEEVCMATRTLFSRYVDVVLWSGESDAEASSAVRQALKAGRDAIRRNSVVARSVSRRVREFEAFERADHRVPALN